MNKSIKVSLLAGLLFASANVVAMQGQPYVGVSVGMATVAVPTLDTNTWIDSGVLGATTDTRSKSAFHIDAGYLFTITPKLQLGPEIGYTQYGIVGNYSFTTILGVERATFKGHYYDLLAKANYAFNPHWAIFTKAGIARASQVKNISGNLIPNADGKTTASKSIPEIALGGSYEFNQDIGADLTVNYIKGDSMDSDDIFNVNPYTPSISVGSKDKVASLITVMLGVHYNF